MTQSCFSTDAIRSGQDCCSESQRAPEHPSNAARQPPRSEENSSLTAQEPV